MKKFKVVYSFPNGMFHTIVFTGKDMSYIRKRAMMYKYDSFKKPHTIRMRITLLRDIL